MLACMRQVEFHRYWVRSSGLDTPSLTDFVMDAETAAREYPGATPEASSRVVWEEPETEEERIEWMAHHPVTMPPSASAAMHHVPAAPGTYHFLDEMGGPPQPIDVIQLDGELVARFSSADGDEAADLPVRDLAGQFLRRP